MISESRLIMSCSTPNCPGDVKYKIHSGVYCAQCITKHLPEDSATTRTRREPLITLRLRAMMNFFVWINSSPFHNRTVHPYFPPFQEVLK